MKKPNNIYEHVVSIINDGMKPLEKIHEKKGVVFDRDDVGAIAEAFFAIYNNMIDYYKELT
ncbi:MAG: hypothetical protein AB7D24_11415 [Sphaerochaeta sp.]|uniref:hypothetical protein n=1 Tax=Sphaerochaeta sp. TaxID=1972642 RepID=UPI003D0D99FE